MDEHQALIEAISARNVEAAKEAIRQHISNQEKTIIENLAAKQSDR